MKIHVVGTVLVASLGCAAGLSLPVVQTPVTHVGRIPITEISPSVTEWLQTRAAAQSEEYTRVGRIPINTKVVLKVATVAEEKVATPVVSY